MDSRRGSPARFRSGFTLIEILVVLSLLGVLFGLSVGYLTRSGTGNLLEQSAFQLRSLLALARNSSVGSDRAFVMLEPEDGGGLTMRAFRFRQVFHWPCEDFEHASEPVLPESVAGVAVGDVGVPSREGNHVIFSGGAIALGSHSWLQFRDGFSFRCLLHPYAGGSAVKLFQKGKSFTIRLVPTTTESFNVEVAIQLAEHAGKDEEQVIVRTGQRDAELLKEWDSPILAGRWHDVRVAYDRSVISVQVNGRLRAVRSDKRAPIKLDVKAPFVVGGGYQGGFDSLVLEGIFEDDDDIYEVPNSITWVDEKGEPVKVPARIHFRNQELDPREHQKPVRVRLQLDAENDGPVREIVTHLSGEVYIK